MASGDLGSRQSRYREESHCGIPGSRNRYQGVVGGRPFVLGDPQAFSPKPVGRDQARGSAQRTNDVGKLLLGSIRGEDLIKAEKIGVVRFALKLVAVPGEAQADRGRRGIARLPNARGGGNVLPGTSQVGKDIFKPINKLLLPLSGRCGHFCRTLMVAHEIRLSLCALLSAPSATASFSSRSPTLCRNGGLRP